LRVVAGAGGFPEHGKTCDTLYPYRMRHGPPRPPFPEITMAAHNDRAPLSAVRLRGKALRNRRVRADRTAHARTGTLRAQAGSAGISRTFVNPTHKHMHRGNPP